MKSFLLHAGVTFAICWTATIIPASSLTRPTSGTATASELMPRCEHDSQHHEADTWRRTAQGWERTSDWTVERPLATPPLCVPFLHIHPLLVAAFQGLLSIGALIAATPGEEISEVIARFLPRGC